ncbi:Fe-S cluster assembly ATP-binding protein [Lachnospiraceae bacterium C10]|jgi:Fe-S cluster assembly ATP-binding protein|nr:Fe-S cluster assembly ATPase SufC [Lachnospiraceae bacterium]SCW30765.1 Fe-S cluster assembly ATP-binding protein [Lachnospiraceae bacterium C10]SDW32652.1 Fe-S cluster assembly ATP-binding protein [Lachnospiraceae bacterium KHCPX20]
MAREILNVSDLKVQIEEDNREILHGVNLSIGEGEVHVIMGPNGAGKSTLGSTLMGDPRYHITGGKVNFLGEDITGLPTDQIAKKGMFLSFQNPVEVPGISLSNFIRTSLENKTGEHIRVWDFKKQLAKTMEVLNMDPSYAERDLNVGFSGGEKKKAEILQLLMLKPELAILDETDSGLDVDAVRTVSAGIEEYKKTVGGALMIITHSTRILEALKVDKTHVLAAGQIVADGDASMVEEINENGFEKYIKEGEDS